MNMMENLKKMILIDQGYKLDAPGKLQQTAPLKNPHKLLLQKKYWRKMHLWRTPMLLIQYHNLNKKYRNQNL